MPKLTFNQQNEIDVPTIILQNRNFDNIGKINNVDNIVYKEYFNGADEVSFTVHKMKDGEITPYWEEITDHKVVYIPEFQGRFYMKVSVDEGDCIEKKCILRSLCEDELSQIILRNIEINTENDILREDYDSNFPTVFYRNPEDYTRYNHIWNNHIKYESHTPEMKKRILKSSSLLHRLLEDKAPHYTIHTVTDSLRDMQRSFSISEKDIYSELTGEIAEQFHCIFQFNSLSREIDVYDLYNVCEDCGFRGDFTDKCPECGSGGIHTGYGEDTTVFISRNNLASSISLETNADSMKNCFYVEGGDDIINSAIRSVNPNGTQYIFQNSAAMKHDMPEELVTKLEQYDKTYQYYTGEHTYNLDESIVNNYNEVVSFVNQNFPDNIHPELSSAIVGYSDLTNALYNAVDLYDFISDAMLPTLDTDGIGITDSLNNIVNGFASGLDGKYQNTIVLSNPKTATQTTVENIITKNARLYYSPAYYDISLQTALYNKATDTRDGKWEGRITLTSLAETDENGKYKSGTTEKITLTIPKSCDNECYQVYINQQIQQAISGKEALSQKQITSISLSDEDFSHQLHFYSLSELYNIKNMFQACLDVVEKLQLNGRKETESLHKEYHDFYYNRIYGKTNSRECCIDAEITLREAQAKFIKKVYYYDYAEMDEPCGVIYDLRKATHDALDIKKYLGSYYHTFCSYRREDKYSNGNYISDGLTNAGIIENAKKLLQAASDELYKLSNPQYTISTEMNNLLALDEFKPLKDYFSVGNWIRMEIDGRIYKLRLLSCQISFEDLQSVQVEFSTAEKTVTGYNDIQDIINSASSIASSYDSVVHQVDKSAHSDAVISHWVHNGLNATSTKFANNDNQEILMDEHGILLRKTDGEMEGQYEPYQLKFLSNGLYFTSDAWRNVDVGIGRIHYTDIDNNPVDTVGVIARKVVGDLIAGEELRIYNADGSVVIDGNGITLDGGKITWKDNNLPESAVNLTDFKTSVNEFKKSVNSCLGTTIDSSSVISPRIGGGYLCISDKTNGSVIIDPSQSIENNGYIFAVKNKSNKVVVGVDTEGDASFSGTITGSSIEGGAITGSSITVENANGNDSFKVSQSGKLTARNATLTGNIAAESFKVKKNICFYVDNIDKYSQMITLEDDGDYGTLVDGTEIKGYKLVIGRQSLLGDDSAFGKFTGVEIRGDVDFKDNVDFKGNVDIKEDLSAKNLTLTGDCKLEENKYLKANVHDLINYGEHECNIFGIDFKKNIHVGTGLYDDKGLNDVEDEDCFNTYISARNDLFLRSKSGKIYLKINETTILTITSSGIESNVPITASNIENLQSEIADLRSEITNLRSEISAIRTQLSFTESNN